MSDHNEKTFPCRYKLVSTYSGDYQGESLLKYCGSVEEADHAYANSTLLEHTSCDDEIFLVDLIAEASGLPRVCKVYETAYNSWEDRNFTEEECSLAHNQPPYDRRS